jgi:hypothetical protein
MQGAYNLAEEGLNESDTGISAAGTATGTCCRVHYFGAPRMRLQGARHAAREPAGPWEAFHGLRRALCCRCATSPLCTPG